MSNLPRLFVLLFCALLGCASAPHPSPHVAAPEPASIKLRLASSLWPPFVDTTDQPRVALDLVSAALARAGYIADNRIVALDDVIGGLKDGSYDGSAALWPSDERAQFLLYSDAYLENRLMLVARKDSAVTAQSFAELKGKKVGIVEGYAYGPELEQATEPVFVRGGSTEQNLRQLLHGELDYVLADALVIQHLIQHYPKQTREKLATGEKPLVTRSLHLALRKDLPDAERIIERFNGQLAEMLRDGSYHQALHVDWIQADIDGDGKLELVAGGDKLGLEPPKSGYRVLSVGKGGSSDSDPGNARFIVKGVAYDSWQAVPDDYKTPQTEKLGAKPATLRVSVFEF